MKPSCYLTALFAVVLLSCTTYQKNNLLGTWRRAPYVIDEPVISIPHNSVLIFLNDSLVDTKYPYFQKVYNELGERRIQFLGTVTKYKVEQDSLSFFNLADSSWSKPRYIEVLTNDSLVISGNGGRSRYGRFSYDVSPEPLFDEILLSSSGCFGACPIINIRIKSNGDVVFLGERYVDNIGFFIGHLSREDYNKIEYEFKIARIDTLSQSYSAAWTDDESILTTFVKNGRIVNSIDNYGHSAPDELEWASQTLRVLFEKLKLQRLDSSKLPFYQALHYFSFVKNDSGWQLSQSESFLLWNYLYESPTTSDKFETKYELQFRRNYTWFPPAEEELRDVDNPARVYDPAKEQKIESIETDGRYFRFKVLGQRPKTLDIGFNFLDRNRAFVDFEQIDQTCCDDVGIEEELKN